MVPRWRRGQRLREAAGAAKARPRGHHPLCPGLVLPCAKAPLSAHSAGPGPEGKVPAGSTAASSGALFILLLQVPLSPTVTGYDAENRKERGSASRKNRLVSGASPGNQNSWMRVVLG